MVINCSPQTALRQPGPSIDSVCNLCVNVIGKLILDDFYLCILVPCRMCSLFLWCSGRRQKYTNNSLPEVPVQQMSCALGKLHSQIIHTYVSALPNISTSFPPQTLKMGVTPYSEIGTGQEIPGKFRRVSTDTPGIPGYSFWGTPFG